MQNNLDVRSNSVVYTFLKDTFASKKIDWFNSINMPLLEIALV